MRATILVTRLTSQDIALIVRELALVLIVVLIGENHIHAPAYSATLTALRGRNVYVGEVILYICARYPSGGVPFLRSALCFQKKHRSPKTRFRWLKRRCNRLGKYEPV